MTTTSEDRMTMTQVHRVYIRASAQQIWDAITKEEWTLRYGFGGHVRWDHTRAGGKLAVEADAQFKAAMEAQGVACPDPIIDGEMLESDEPHRLVQTFRMLMDPEMAAEGYTRISYEIKELPDGTCSLTLTHELENAPRLALILSGALEDTGAGGGWPWILSDLKTLLETGTSFAGK